MQKIGGITNESGFSVIELVVTTGIVTLLSAIALAGYKEYRKTAYHSVAETQLVNARTALEIGKSTNEDMSSSVLIALQKQSSGPLTSSAGQELAPGFVLQDDSVIVMYHKSDCTSALCLEDAVLTRHCDSDKMHRWYRYKGGYVIKQSNISPTGYYNCS